MSQALAQRQLGLVLHLAQKYSGASQTRLATATGLLQGRVSELIRGKRATTALDVYERVADGLDMPDHARVALGIAPRRNTSTLGEIDAVYGAQSAASEDVQRCARGSSEVEILAVRGLGLLGMSESLLRPAMPPNATVRVLLLDPHSAAAEQRAGEIGESLTGFVSGIELAMTRLTELAELRPDLTVECRVYATVPTWRIIALEPAMFVSSFGPGHEGHRSTMYKVSRSHRPGSLWQGFRRFLDTQHETARRVL